MSDLTVQQRKEAVADLACIITHRQEDHHTELGEHSAKLIVDEIEKRKISYLLSFTDAREMLVDIARRIGFPLIPADSDPLPDFYLLKLNKFIKDLLAKYHAMEAEHPDKVCSNDHPEIRYWSQNGPGDPETCPICSNRVKPKDPNIGCVLS